MQFCRIGDTQDWISDGRAQVVQWRQSETRLNRAASSGGTPRMGAESARPQRPRVTNLRILNLSASDSVRLPDGPDVHDDALRRTQRAGTADAQSSGANARWTPPVGVRAIDT